MKSFNANATCPKCRSLEISTVWCEKYQYTGGTALYEEGPCTDLDRMQRHLDRVCKRCSYGWVEAPLDAQQETT